MSYEKFMERVFEFLDSVGGGFSAKFKNDTDDGKYIADCQSKETDERIQCIGNSIALKITVRFGATLAHQAMI